MNVEKKLKGSIKFCCLSNKIYVLTIFILMTLVLLEQCLNNYNEGVEAKILNQRNKVKSEQNLH